ncbi:MAG: protein-L-isoaspartate O-methyltransferase [Rhodobacterales bacterium 32-66-7]|nr:MAG: protein-L-isoaspartate O-methyltransferase [Rhodobacterales bacterium 32-66-7]
MTTGEEEFIPSDELAERKMRFLFALRSRGVTDTRVIACGQTISQPSIVGLMTQALQVHPRDTVLEVGTGSGYQAAILSHLARRVYTVDRYRRLAREAGEIFRQLGIVNITTIAADGSFGLPDQAPFDRIIVTAAAEDPPGPLMEQLKPGGIMVLPVGQSDAVQSLIKVTRNARGFDYEELRPVRFVPLVEGLGSE